MFIQTKNVAGFELISGTTCYKPSLNEVVTINEALGGDVAVAETVYRNPNIVLSYDYKVPAIASNGDKYNMLCLKVPIYRSDKTKTSTYKYLPINQRGTDGKFLLCAEGQACNFADPSAKDTLRDCMDSAFLQNAKFYSTGTLLFYADQNSCTSASLSGKNTGNLKNDGACYWMEPGWAYDSSSSDPPEEVACSCYSADYLIKIGGNTRPPGAGWWPTNTYGVYYGRNIFGNTLFVGGPEFSYESSALFNTNLAECEADHPDRYYSKNSKRCYRTLDECKVASICSVAKENHLFIVKSQTNYKSLTPNEQSTKSEQMMQCAQQNKTQLVCLNDVYGGAPLSGTVGRSDFFKCTCERPWTCGLIPGASCDKTCGLVRIPAPDFKVIKPVEIASPLALINVVVNFLFWLAVVIFIINMLSSGLEYIRGGDEPDKLKEASDRITGTIFGFIFLLVASGVINYIISRINEFIP